MGKRSNFNRKDKDFYVTPFDAVKPLVQFLPTDIFSYIDPCYGTGAVPCALVRLLFSAICCARYDLYPEQYDAMKVGKLDASKDIYPIIGKFFITNPPWDRKKQNGEILHKIIDNLAGQKPTWLLFDADWMHTKQAAPYMKYCVKVVAIGRVKWFPDSKHTGKDNCCWYLFDKNYDGLTEFIARS